jgi:hypothetical protein
MARLITPQAGGLRAMSPWAKGKSESDADTTEHRPAVSSEYASEQERLDELARATKGWKTSAVVLAALMIAPLAWSKIDWSTAGGAKQPAIQEAAASTVDRSPNAIDTGAMCDLAVKRTLVSEDSFDSELGGSFHAEGNIGVMSRKFAATNGFGAKLTSRYTCKWDSVNDRIVSLTITDPFGETTKLR